MCAWSLQKAGQRQSLLPWQVATLLCCNRGEPPKRYIYGCWHSLQDSHIGTAVLDLAAVQPGQLGYVELPLTWTKDKYGQQGRQSRLVVGVPGWVASFGTLMAATQQIPGGCWLVGETAAAHGGGGG